MKQYGISANVTSGKRTAIIGTAGNKSHHLTGNAIDIAPSNGMT
jgi:hypothetical protein